MPYHGHLITVIQQDDDSWLVGVHGEDGNILPGQPTLCLNVGKLGASNGWQPVEQGQALYDLLANRDSESGHLLLWLQEQVDAVIQHFYGTDLVEPIEKNDVLVMRLVQQAKLCKVWLDFLQGDADFERGQNFSPDRMLLWRRYCRTLAALYEALAAPRKTSRTLQKLTHESVQKEIQREYYRALRNWIQILLDRNIHDIRLQPVEKEPASLIQTWEAEVDDLLWQGDRLRRFFRQEGSGQEFMESIVRQWYLPRYDLYNVGRLCHARLSYTESNATALPYLQRCWQILFVRGLAYPWVAVFINALLLVIGIGQGGLVGLVLVALAGLFVLAQVGLTLVTAVKQRIRRFIFYPFAPRLVAGTVVGLLAQAGLNERFIDFTFHGLSCPTMSWHWEGWSIVVGMIGAAGLYVFVDAFGRLNDVKAASLRTALILGYGWAQATLLAGLISWWFVGRLLPLGASGAPSCRHLLVPGGTLHFDYVIAAGALALVIGVFTQLLWEDRTITEPL